MPDKQNVRGPNTASLIKGYVDMDTGLRYDDEGNPVISEAKNNIPVLQRDRIGIFERLVHTDGSVSTYQVEEASNPDEIQTPVPLPGGQQDQAGTGQVDDVKQDVKGDVKTTSGSIGSTAKKK